MNNMPDGNTLVEELEGLRNKMNEEDFADLELLADSIERKLNQLSEESEELGELEVEDIHEEISRDSEKLEQQNQLGNSMLWMYKDFVSEEDCNEWLRVFSQQIIEINPSTVGRLEFFVKLSTR
jgi:hypothetical protein